MGSGGVRPSGTVTFLFTDIEGSTRRWEANPDAMRVELAAHDDVLRVAVESQGGWLFKHTGDGVCAAFASARAGVDAAVHAQRSLGLPVRMGIATGEAEQRGEDYFGPALNRAARVMAVGHGGQILVSATTAALVSGVELQDLGEHRLRDLTGVEHLHQVCADGLAVDFPRLRTVDAVPGNLPAQATSFVGRDIEVDELVGLVRAHRLVTLTGVGGVGKTRLAVQVAAELVPDFGDGVWLVELAPVGDPDAVPDAVATALGITQQPGRTVTESVAEALAGRRLLLVVDNCEHVLDAAADLVEAVLARTSTVTVIATSREGLRVGAEHLWPVPSLDVRAGASSAAVELFIERARAVTPGFTLADDTDENAVEEICRRLDGIALAIELAAARMVSMNPTEVLTRLTDRFRLLSGSRRGLERHQTLRQAVQWSYDLLTPDEQLVLGCCSVFADGFDVIAATAVIGGDLDDYEVLDLLDSLVRKSLVTAGQVGGSTRYGLLETIRQFAEDQLAAGGTITDVRDRHAQSFAAEALAYFDLWDGPRQRIGTDWVDTEFANLRAGFRWAADQNDLEAATAIAASTTQFGWGLQRFEPVAWAEELLPAATAADISQLPSLYLAATLCMFTGRPEEGVAYAQTATDLEADSRYHSFFTEPIGFANEATAHLMAGRIDRFVELCATLANERTTEFRRVFGLCGLTYLLPAVGRVAEAVAIADECLDTARAYGNPFYIAWAFPARGRAFAEADPAKALDAYHEGLDYARAQRLPLWEGLIARDGAALEAAHGDRDRGLALFDSAINLCHQSGDITNLAVTLANLALFFDTDEQPDVAATIYGATTPYASTVMVVGLADGVDHLRAALGDSRFDECVATGAAMELGEAVRYARHHIDVTRQRLADRP
jgi:predicted ATPase/class 3 adenylate cyclase